MFPITHGLIGWTISQPLEKRKDRFFVTLASVIPDLDGLGMVISIDYYAKYHHVFGHNVFFGLSLSIISYIFCKEKIKASLLAFASFTFHIIGDLLGSGAGWGIPFWWPVSKKFYEFRPPFQWELDSWQNLLVTFFCIILMVKFAITKNRTVMEMFSLRADKEVVAVFKRWFGEVRFFKG